MDIQAFIRKMPKVELHVHLEGSTQPETLLALTKKYAIPIPADDLEGVRRWFTFSDFDHFISIYLTFSACLRTPEDIEWIARQFLAGQAEQNILYTEFTYTAFAQYVASGISFEDQLSALNKAREWAQTTLGVQSNIIIDIPRVISAADGDLVSRWAVSGMGRGVVALGLGGPEVGHPAEDYTSSFAIASAAGLASIPHAGETVGPESIWGAINSLNAVRIGHGVRCLEDPALVAELREKQIPLEVCPTSNVCLKVVQDMASHPLPKLMSEGLYITINSDDPPMFNTSLTNEYLQIANVFGFGRKDLKKFVMNAVNASLLNAEEKQQLKMKCLARFQLLENDVK